MSSTDTETQAPTLTPERPSQPQLDELYKLQHPGWPTQRPPQQPDAPVHLASLGIH